MRLLRHVPVAALASASQATRTASMQDQKETFLSSSSPYRKLAAIAAKELAREDSWINETLWRGTQF